MLEILALAEKAGSVPQWLILAIVVRLWSDVSKIKRRLRIVERRTPARRPIPSTNPLPQ